MVANTSFILTFSREEEFGKESRKSHERYYIVAESMLKLLMLVCVTCTARCQVTVKKLVGTMVVLQQKCVNGHQFTWQSQENHGTLPLGNLRMAASILFCGGSFHKLHHFLEAMSIPHISFRTYYNIQCLYAIPAIMNTWAKKHEELLKMVRDSGPLDLAGDARCCTPGHTAKFGSYSMMDLKSGKIIDTQLVQVNYSKNT